MAPLGIRRLYGDGTAFAGYGVPTKLFFRIGRRDAVASTAHIAFAAPDLVIVDTFHAAALAAGGHDNGAPGFRPHYHARY